MCIRDSPKTALLKRGQKVEMTGKITAKALTTQGRKLFGELRVVNSEGTVLGTGEVVVGTVVAAG